jgi:hypothetical protein
MGIAAWLQPGLALCVLPPACLQALLSHADSLGGSSNSRSGSQKHIMALKMSKMEK